MPTYGHDLLLAIDADLLKQYVSLQLFNRTSSSSSWEIRRWQHRKRRLLKQPASERMVCGQVSDLSNTCTPWGQHVLCYKEQLLLIQSFYELCNSQIGLRSSENCFILQKSPRSVKLWNWYKSNKIWPKFYDSLKVNRHFKRPPCLLS